MSCEICGRGSCTRSFHSIEAQEEFDERQSMSDDVDTLREELQSARAELAALRADAERYRVARAKVCIVGDAFHVINLRPTYVAPDAAIEFDAAIDAARGGDK